MREEVFLPTIDTGHLTGGTIDMREFKEWEACPTC